jgi:hypothetical protein
MRGFHRTEAADARADDAPDHVGVLIRYLELRIL